MEERESVSYPGLPTRYMLPAMERRFSQGRENWRDVIGENDGGTAMGRMAGGAGEPSGRSMGKK